MGLAHEGCSCREVIFTAVCGRLRCGTLGEADAWAEAVSVILAQLNTVELAARGQIDRACRFAGHQLGDGKLVCMYAMVEERRLFGSSTTGDNRPSQGGGISFEARAYPQPDQIAMLDYPVAGPP